MHVRTLLALNSFLLLTVAARAGLFDPKKPEVELLGSSGLEALPHPAFVDRMADLLVVGNPSLPKNTERDKVIAARDALAKQPSLTPHDRIRLAILRIRLREFDPALMELQQAYAANPRDFYAMSALGTVYQQMGQVPEAVRYLEAARDLFPADFPGSPAQIAAVRDLLAAQLKLARLRFREQAGRPGRRPSPPVDVDDLFGVRFVGPSGQYEPGNLAPDQKAKLPANAIATVQQLLLWLPDDARLYWLLGELYAADGELENALSVFEECLNVRRLDAPLLKQHRQAVRDAMDARRTAWIPGASRWWTAGLIVGPIMVLLIVFQFRQTFHRFRSK